MKRDAFTSKQACYLSGCTSHQLRYWDKVKLVTPTIQSSKGKPGVPKLYSFRDIVSLRVIKTLLDNRKKQFVHPKVLRRANHCSPENMPVTALNNPLF